jgi:hypothetical protein
MNRVLLTLLSVACLANGQATWRRGAYMGKFAVERPWESKGLGPVKMMQAGRGDAFAICGPGEETLPIVVPARGTPGAGYYHGVAAFLKGYLDTATGVSFQIVEDAPPRDVGIYLGPCAQPGGNPLIEKAAALAPEHFAFHAAAGRITLIGRDISDAPGKPMDALRVTSRRQSRGTFFAAVDFLERFVGVRFYMPGDLGIHVPYLEGRAVVVPPVSYTDGPAFEQRLSSYGNYLTKDHELLGYTRKQGLAWMIALRTADYYALKSGHTDGYWHTFYAAEHPDWFALREDGSRMIGKRGKLAAQRCYTSEAAFQEHLRVIDHYYRTGEGRKLFANSPPNDKYIYWWPNDGFRGCHCPACLALTKPDASHGSVLSPLVWGYTAKLARAIQERWPGKTLVSSFYSRWADGPGDIKLPKNVTFMIVETREAYLKEPVYWDRVTHDLSEKMALAGAPVPLWSHYPHRPRISNRMDAPYLVPHVLKKYAQWLRGRSSGVYLNGHGTSSFALDGVVTYLYHKLMWNPDLDVDAMLAEYCQIMFGPAGPDVSTYYQTIIKRWEGRKWENLTEEEVRNPHGEIKWSRYYQDAYPREVRMALKALLKAAERKTAEGTVYQARTHWLAQGTQPFFIQGELLDGGEMVIGECTRFTPIIDGALSDWEGHTPVLLRNNTNGEKASVKTELYTAHDAENLYLAVRAFEPDEVRAAPAGSPRDFPLWRHDSIEVFLCSEQPGIKAAGLNITDQYHQLILDANGNIYDSYKALAAERVDPKITVDCRLQARQTEGGYTIELAIPYTSLNAVPPAPGTHWFANVYRNRKRDTRPDELLQAWSPTLASAHNTARFARLDFPAKTIWEADFETFAEHWQIAVPRDDIQVTPTVTDGRLRLHVGSNALDAKKNQGKSTEINISIRPKHRPRVTKLDGPVNLRWRFRFKGPGLLRIRTVAGDKGNRNRVSHWIPRPSNYEDAGWVVGIGDKPDKGSGELTGLAYCFFALKILPNADFTFDVDQLKVLER